VYRAGVITSAVTGTQRFAGSLCPMFGQTLLAHLATESFFVTNTMLDKNV